MLRIILLIGNIVYLGLTIYIIFSEIIHGNPPAPGDPIFIFFIPMMILFLLNIFILVIRKDAISLYSRRKKLEEKIKIQEDENRLKKLKNKNQGQANGEIEDLY